MAVAERPYHGSGVHVPPATGDVGSYLLGGAGLAVGIENALHDIGQRPLYGHCQVLHRHRPDLPAAKAGNCRH